MSERGTMTVRQAAQRLDVHENTIRNWIKIGHLEAEVLPSGFRRPFLDSVEALRGGLSGPMMDRPAYELVRLIEAELDDADQITDTPQRPNNIAVWGIRMLLEPYGGKPHRWQWPKCFECDHQLPLHNYGPCDLCGCAITSREISDGARDEALDEAVEQALRYEREHRG